MEGNHGKLTMKGKQVISMKEQEDGLFHPFCLFYKFVADLFEV